MRLRRNGFSEPLLIALSTIRAHLLRSSLSILGVAVGIWTIITIASFIAGIDTTIRREIEAFGTRSIFIARFDLGLSNTTPLRDQTSRKRLTTDDALAVAQLPAVELAVPVLNISNDYNGQKMPVTYKGKTSYAVELYGTTPSYERTNIQIVTTGRFFTQYESDTNQDVCLVGASVAANFFPYTSPLNQKLKIGGREFRVIGTFMKREQFIGGLRNDQDQSNFIFIPLGVARKLKPAAEDLYINAIALPDRLAEARDQIIDLLRTRRHVPLDQPDDFGLTTTDAIVAQFRSLTFGVSVTMVLVSSISLLVAGISIMNIMLVSVTERAREIGLRKAVGARRRDIQRQFLVEAMTLTGVGGVIGLTVGWGSTLLLRFFFPSEISLWATAAGLCVSIGTGLVSGLWPARKAARLNPIDCLRYQ